MRPGRNPLNYSGNVVLSAEFAVAVALGKIDGWTSFRQFGMNDAVGIGTEEMWPPGTLRTLPAAAGAVSVVSSSADDASPGGTGALTVQIDGLDGNYEQLSETVALNGLTPVVTTGTFLRINGARVLTAGTGQVNAGNISFSIGGALQSYIEANEGRSHHTHYTVPAGYSLVISYYAIGVGRMAGSTDLHILGQIKPFGTGTAWQSISDIYLWDGENHANAQTITVAPEKTELRQRIISTSATQAYGIVGGYLVDNDHL